MVLLVGALGMATGWLLPFALGTGSLYDRAFGDPSGYGIAFWTGYDQISGLASQAYFGFAAPVPILVALLVALAVAGIAKATPGMLQVIGLTISLLWSLGLLILFVVVEVLDSDAGDLLDHAGRAQPRGDHLRPLVADRDHRHAHPLWQGLTPAHGRSLLSELRHRGRVRRPVLPVVRHDAWRWRMGRPPEPMRRCLPHRPGRPMTLRPCPSQRLQTSRH